MQVLACTQHCLSMNNLTASRVPVLQGLHALLRRCCRQKISLFCALRSATDAAAQVAGLLVARFILSEDERSPDVEQEVIPLHHSTSLRSLFVRSECGALDICRSLLI